MRVETGQSDTYVASTADAVRPAAFGMAAAYLTVALPPALLTQSGTARTLMGTTLSCAAALSAVIGWVARSNRRTRRLPQHVLFAALAGLAVATSLINLVVQNTDIATVNLIMTLIAATALIHVRVTAMAVAVLTVTGWLVVGLTAAPEALTVDTASAMAMACVVGSILHLSRRRNVQRLNAARAELQRMAATDELTGLHNRRFLLETGQRLVTAAHGEGRDVCLLYVDVDGLKSVNDTGGHAAGDRLIASVADVLSEVFRDAQIVARTGGDEFVVLAVGFSPAQARRRQVQLARHLRARGSSASCGIAFLDHRAALVPLAQLLAKADAAMYEDKVRRRRATGRPEELAVAMGS